MKKKLLVLTLSLLAIAFLAHSEEAKKGLKVFIKTRTLSDVILNGNWICCSIQSVVTLFGLSMGSPRARLQMSRASTPRALETPKKAV